jgi:hypothetical protein
VIILTWHPFYVIFFRMQSGSPTSRTTKHMQARMSQRGISGELVQLVQRHGRDEQGKLVLNRRDLRSLLNDVRNLQKVVLKALDKGGLVVVEAEGTLITTYNVDSFNPDCAYGH